MENYLSKRNKNKNNNKNTKAPNAKPKFTARFPPREKPSSPPIHQPRPTTPTPPQAQPHKKLNQHVKSTALIVTWPKTFHRTSTPSLTNYQPITPWNAHIHTPSTNHHIPKCILWTPHTASHPLQHISAQPTSKTHVNITIPAITILSPRFFLPTSAIQTNTYLSWK